MSHPEHGQEMPSAWIRRWSHLIRPAGSVLDVACGQGRHLKWLAGQGHAVTGVDRSAQALEQAGPDGTLILADIETGAWPLMDGQHPREFDAVVVTNYLWRALFPRLLASLAPGGVLLYETFAWGQETVGRPSRPEFLLEPGELLLRCKDLHVVAYEDGFQAVPGRFVQRIAAVRTSGSDLHLSTGAGPARYQLGDP